MGIILVSFVGFEIYASAQGQPKPFDTGLTDLISRLADPFKNAKARKVVVLDFTGPNGQVHPIGKWLADQVSAAIQKEFPSFQIIDRSKLNFNNQTPKPSPDLQAVMFNRDIKQARSVRANVFIIGTFAKISDAQIGVSLAIVGLAELEKTHEMRTWIVPISKEIMDLSQEPIPGLELRDGYHLAGSGGITMPICISCPPPDSARNSEEGGFVHLELVVTAEGRSGRIKIITSSSPETAARAARVVQTWRFTPALGFDGNPIVVVVPIQIDFH
jgi:TonB family protein